MAWHSGFAIDRRLGGDVDQISRTVGGQLDRARLADFNCPSTISRYCWYFCSAALHRTAAAGLGMPVEERRGGAANLVAVVLLTSLGVLVGQRIGAGDVQVVLQADQLRRLVGLEQGIEGDVRRHAGGTLGAGEQLHHHHSVGLGVVPSRKRFGLERGHLLQVLLVKGRLELGRACLGLGGNVRLAGELGRASQQTHDRGLLIEAGFRWKSLVDLLGQVDREPGIGLRGDQRLECLEPDLAGPMLAKGFGFLGPGLEQRR